LARAAEEVRRWPATVAFVLLGAAYALVSDRLTFGPPWWLLVVAVLVVIGANVLRWRGFLDATRWFVMAGLAVVTLTISVSAVYLVFGLLKHTADAGELLQGGALIWFSNMLTFALWYWEVDGGGPAYRHASGRGSTDFAFPQRVLDETGWMPDFLDYAFLAFNTSTAFSPTDTMVLARRAKALMMYQSVISLVTVVVLVARAINAL
jgi:uncharacterized membrane protein